MNRVFERSLRVLDVHRHRDAQVFELGKLSVDLVGMIEACEVASFWSRLIAHAHPREAATMQRLTQSLRATAFTFSRLDLLRAKCLESLPKRIRTVETSLHASLTSYVESLSRGVGEEATTTNEWTAFQQRLQDASQLTRVEIHQVPQDMQHALLSLLGHYFAVHTSLSAVAEVRRVVLLELRQFTDPDFL